MMNSQSYILAVSFLALFLSACNSFNTRQTLSAREISKTVKPNVVLINYQNKGGHGSGFFVEGSKALCTILTARHVVDDPDDLQLKTDDGNIWGDLEVKPFSSHDLAIITFKPSGNKCPYQALKSGDSDLVSEGDQVYISGYFKSSGSLVKHFASGNVTAISQLPEGYGISYAATTGGGMSGGPVLNRFGEVIAIHGRSDTEIRQLANSRGVSLHQLQQFKPEQYGSTINTFKWGIPINLYLANLPVEFPKRLVPTRQTPRKIAGKETNKEADVWNNRGLSLHESEKYQEAIDSYETATEIDLDHAEAWNNRGRSLHELGRYQEAIDSYETATEIDPDYAEAWYSRGNSLDDLGKYQEAIASYDKAIKLNSEDAYTWNNRGVSLNNLGKHLEALISYEKAIEINSNYAYAWNNRGNSLNNLGKHLEALTSYEKAIKIDSDYASAWNGCGFSLENLERYDEALKFYEKAIELDPSNENAVNNRKRVLEQLE